MVFCMDQSCVWGNLTFCGSKLTVSDLTMERSDQMPRCALQAHDLHHVRLQILYM